MKIYRRILLVLFACVFYKTFGHDHENSVRTSLIVEKKLFSRTKRTLPFPNPTNLLFILGLGTPLQLDNESVIIGLFAKFLYAMPTNATDFTDQDIYFKRNEKSRWSIYKILEKTAGIYGLGGKACLLRAICEISSVPFNLNHGIIGQLIQVILTPSSTKEPYEEYADREYHAAESLGRHVGENCHALYPECERSALDVFSTTNL